MIHRRMRLPTSAHTSRPWRIHELTSDFRVEDVWALPVVGTREDFSRFLQLLASFDPSHTPSRATRALFTIRQRIGAVFGLDRRGDGIGSRAATLRDRLPADLSDGPASAFADGLPFAFVYRTDDEWAAEAANRTMHGVIHIGWIPDGAGAYRGQMAILVKPNGLLGASYMAAVKPFRHWIVYPAIMREIERRWRSARAPL